MLDLSIDDAHSRLTLPPSNPLFDLLKADVKTSITVVAHLQPAYSSVARATFFHPPMRRDDHLESGLRAAYYARHTS